MFRELTRKKQELTKDECLRLLNEEKRGVLSVCGDNGYPYGMPMNHFLAVMTAAYISTAEGPDTA